MGEGAWGAAVHGVTKSWTRLSDFTSLTSYLSLCLSLNSFCDETSRTRASLGLEGRYHGFCLGLNLSHVGLSFKQRVPAHVFKTQSVVNSFSWAARTKYHRPRCLKTRTKFSYYSRQHIKKQTVYFADKGLSSQSYDFFQ